MQERLSYLREKTAALTSSPGVYLMKDKQNQIIYIGKAKNLHKRVSSYFRIGAEYLPKVEKMVSHVWDYDFIVTDSEYEALLLECSLIKQHQPHYNILLKDDKGYCYIRVSDEPFPRITVEKNKTKAGNYIGTYTSGFTAHSAVEEVNTVFQLPTCKKKFPESFRKSRPCLNYYIKRCAGICQGNFSEEAYQERIQQAVQYLKTGSQDSVKRLQKEMLEAAENLEFEKAAVLRDRMKAIEKAAASQKILDNEFQNADIIALADNQDRCCISVLVYRNGRLQDKISFEITDYAGEAVFDSFIHQFYQEHEIPSKILISQEVSDIALTEKLLSEKTGHKIKLYVPKKVTGVSLIQMARQNSAEMLAVKENRTGKELLAVEALGKLLGLEKVPKYIESYDISNLASDAMVAGMVVFENGRPLKKAYKRFSMKENQNQNDYACMQEVIRRRLSHLYDNSDIYFSRVPDLILLDGGKGHVNAVIPIIEELCPEIALFGMVKDSKHRTRAITTEDREIQVSGEAFQLITRIQDEVHRYSVAYM
ncbi:MAG: excinuclease ABC subunit UvrC, partial [Oscillospiraceae bacterium]|nr:excinuclease ABC subunit UvrC [Oscillospiraceae bacterium]